MPTFSICFAIESAVLLAHLSRPDMNFPKPDLAPPPLPVELAVDTPPSVHGAWNRIFGKYDSYSSQEITLMSRELCTASCHDSVSH